MKSIKTRMVVLLGALLVVVCAGLGVVSYITASKALTDNVEQTIPQMAVQASQVVEEHLDGILLSLEIIAANEKIKNVDTPWDEKIVVLNEEVKRNGHVKMGIADLNGDYITTTGDAPNIKDREHFQKALKGERAISDPLLSKTDNSLSNFYAVPIKQGNEIVGVLIATRDAYELSDVTNSIKFGKSGSAYMINKAGIIIAHYDQETVKNNTNILEDSKKDSKLLALAELQKQGIEGKSLAGEYWYKGITKFMGFAPVKSTGWSIYVTAPKDDVLSGLGVMQKSIFLFSLLFMVIALIIVFFISKALAKGIGASSIALDTLSKGDFTLIIPEVYLKQKDEIGKITQSLKTMRDSIKNMIITVKENSDNIDKQSENLSAVAQQMSSSAEEVTNAIQDVAKGTGKQAGDLVDAVSILNHFGDELDSIVHSIKDVDINSKEIDTMANESSSNMASLSESVNRVSDRFIEFTQKITGLDQSVTKINEITDLINSIADQTNLLALNASIEAARAGEAGRGFAVVADEIRKLAEQAKASAGNINNLVNGISSETNEIVKTTKAMSGELNNQVSVISIALNSFGKIIDAVDIIVPKIEAVNTSAVSLNGEKETIMEKLEGVSSISEEVSASSQEIAASSEEMSASTQEVASSAQTLSGMTKDMMEQVNKFKL